MSDFDLFKELVRYHIETNLPKALAAGPIEEGVENKATHGCFIAANGATLEQNLINDEVIAQRPDDKHVYLLVRNGNTLADYLDGHAHVDGGHVWDGKNKLITHVARFDTSRNKLKWWQHLIAAFNPSYATRTAMDYEQFVPSDFLSHDGSIPIYQHDTCRLGTKTQAAIDLAHRYNVQTMLIKQSAYGSTTTKDCVRGVGLGKVCRFDKHGLAEEILFVHDTSEGPYVDTQHSIAAVRCCYEQRDGKVVKVSEERIDPATYFATAEKRPVRRPSTQSVVAYAAT